MTFRPILQSILDANISKVGFIRGRKYPATERIKYTAADKKNISHRNWQSDITEMRVN